MNSLELKTSSVFGVTPNMRSGVTRCGQEEEVMVRRTRKRLLNCQLSMLLASTGQSPQQLDRISDKAPIQVCPRHGLSLAQTPPPVSLLVFSLAC